MISSLSLKETPVETPILTTTTQNRVQFKAENSLEKTPSKDTFEKNNKKKKTIGIIAGTIAAAAIILGIICYSKGGKGGANKSFGERMRDGWKELRGKAESKSEPAKPETAEATEPTKPDAPKEPKPEATEAPKAEEKPIEEGKEPKTEAAEEAIPTTAELVSPALMKKIKTGKISHFTLERDGNTFIVKNGVVAECKNQHGEDWLYKFRDPADGAERDYVETIIREIESVMNKENAEIFERVSNIELTPYKNKNRIKLSKEQVIYYIQNAGK